MKKLIFLFILFAFASCKKEELLVPNKASHHESITQIQVYQLEMYIYKTGDTISLKGTTSDVKDLTNNGIKIGEKISFSVDSVVSQIKIGINFYTTFSLSKTIFTYGSIDSRSFVVKTIGIDPYIGREWLFSTISICCGAQKVPVKFKLIKI